MQSATGQAGCAFSVTPRVGTRIVPCQEFVVVDSATHCADTRTVEMLS